MEANYTKGQLAVKRAFSSSDLTVLAATFIVFLLISNAYFLISFFTSEEFLVSDKSASSILLGVLGLGFVTIVIFLLTLGFGMFLSLIHIFHWRSVGQRDPLVEYRSESQKLFDSLQYTLRDEVLRAIYHVHKTDAITREAVDDEHETELTKLAENSVERGVNEVTGGELNRDHDFEGGVKKAKSNTEANHQRNVARKKKKSQRQNRKKSR